MLQLRDIFLRLFSDCFSDLKQQREQAGLLEFVFGDRGADDYDKQLPLFREVEPDRKYPDVFDSFGGGGIRGGNHDM